MAPQRGRTRPRIAPTADTMTDARISESRAPRWYRMPLFWILAFATFMRLFALTWGLPAADGWDDDGVAPRNFLVGAVQTFVPGAFFTYPPLHMILLMVLTLPGWLLALHTAHSYSRHDVIAAFIQVPYMTFFAIVARSVSLAMSVATIAVIGRMTTLVAGRRAGIAAAAACALNATLTYSGQVTNLDGPYLFWSALALWAWMRLIAEHNLDRIRPAMLAMAAAIATKDQAYAVFALSVPVALLLWFGLDPWARDNAKTILRRLAFWSAIALVALLAIDGAITNPSGFAKRLAFLAGPASQDYTQYQADLFGRLALLEDMVRFFPRAYPAALGVLGVCGIIIHIVKGGANRPVLVAGLLPALAMVSFTLAFNCIALRSENRFLLPQSLFLSCYIGIAADCITHGRPRWIRYATNGVVFCLALMAFSRCAAIDAAFVGDSRYDAEQWMKVATRPGDGIEAYGLNAFLPRFPVTAVVSRLDRKPLQLRNPLPGVREIDQAFRAVADRNPRFLVINGFWVQPYLDAKSAPPVDGRISQRARSSVGQESENCKYFTALFNGTLPYRLAHVARYHAGLWPALEGYESLAQTIFIFERVPSPEPSSGPKSTSR